MKRTPNLISVETDFSCSGLSIGKACIRLSIGKIMYQTQHRKSMYQTQHRKNHALDLAQEKAGNKQNVLELSQEIDGIVIQRKYYSVSYCGIYCPENNTGPVGLVGGLLQPIRLTLRHEFYTCTPPAQVYFQDNILGFTSYYYMWLTYLQP